MIEPITYICINLIYNLDTFEPNAELEAFPRYSHSIKVDEILVRPNPANTHFTLENKTIYKVLSVSVVDIYGRTFSNQSQLKDRLLVDCSNFPTGVYFVKTSHKSGYYNVKRVIIK